MIKHIIRVDLAIQALVMFIDVNNCLDNSIFGQRFHYDLDNWIILITLEQWLEANYTLLLYSSKLPTMHKRVLRCLFSFYLLINNLKSISSTRSRCMLVITQSRALIIDISIRFQDNTTRYNFFGLKVPTNS